MPLVAELHLLLFGDGGARVGRLEDVNARVGVRDVQALAVLGKSEADDAAHHGARVVADGDLAQQSEVPRTVETNTAV